MVTKTKNKPNILIIIAVVLFLLVGILQFYVQNVSKLFNRCGEIYRCEQTTTDEYGYDWKTFYYLVFTDDWKIDLIVSDEYFTGISRLRYDYHVHTWNNIGNVFFKTDSLLSATFIEEDVTPVTFNMNCIQARGYNDTTTFEPDARDISTMTVHAFFSNHNVNFDGIVFDKIEKLDPVLEEMMRLFLDNDEIFFEHLG